MLTLTTEAAEAVDSLLNDPQIPDDAGLRLSANSEQEIAVALTEGPADGDQVIEEGGARVFVAPEVAPMLDHAVLLAEDQDGRIAFGLRAQEDL